MPVRVYMAGPIQHAHDRGKGWRERLKIDYPNIAWLDPFDKYDSIESDEWSDERIVEEDKELIDKADALLIHYEKVATWGTPREHEYAIQNGIPVYVQTTEEDPSPWLTTDARAMTETFDKAIDRIKEELTISQ